MSCSLRRASPQIPPRDEKGRVLKKLRSSMCGTTMLSMICGMLGSARKAMNGKDHTHHLANP